MSVPSPEILNFSCIFTCCGVKFNSMTCTLYIHWGYVKIFHSLAVRTFTYVPFLAVCLIIIVVVVIIRLRRSRSAAAYSRQTFPCTICQSVGLYVDKFCYLGSVLSSNATVGDDISSRLSKANVAFGRLNKCLWCNHGISIATKVAVYRAMILTSLLYGCEGWTLYRHHIQQLDQFHMWCLRKIAHIKWQDHIPCTRTCRYCSFIQFGLNHYQHKTNQF